ncbi:hypothetical protein BC833DRAFT_610515 [Globomyces pollinis-pini]|nr:hypothetical protein BC833DRAFT_610515 [Globomyces pollinis-pini]
MRLLPFVFLTIAFARRYPDNGEFPPDSLYSSNSEMSDVHYDDEDEYYYKSHPELKPKVDIYKWNQVVEQSELNHELGFIAGKPLENNQKSVQDPARFIAGGIVDSSFSAIETTPQIKKGHPEIFFGSILAFMVLIGAGTLLYRYLKKRQSENPSDGLVANHHAADGGKYYVLEEGSSSGIKANSVL